MVVDDHITSRMLTVETLQGFGIKNIHVSKDGRECYNFLNARPVHLVISDLYMPDIDGLHLLQAIRAHPRLSKLGFIIVTGRKDQNVIEKARALGVNNVLSKPFEPPVLKQAIEAVVGKFS
jgi:two-component system chemotaxis response regulator CheY